ncbi:MAG: AAA family ATPase [Candidatus Dormibacteria bacterium]
MPSPFRTGVVFGKFYPPHRGHKLVIDTALAQVEHLTVFVCHRTEHDIPGELRAAWMREIHPTADIRLIDDIYPDDDSELWARLTRQWLGYAPDAVFTSEAYGARFAELLGAAHVEVDRARLQVPCSGTAVRADPLGQWDHLEPCVRAHFVRRVCIVGAESTGTTTLARALAAHFRTTWVPEYGREYTEQVKGIDAKWESEEFEMVAREQCRREDASARDANRILLCDTDALATAIWHERYLGYPSRAVQAIADSRRYDLYLLTDVDIPFVQDGYRDGEHLREWMHGRFIAELSRIGRKFQVIRGSLQQRLERSVEVIERRTAST